VSHAKVVETARFFLRFGRVRVENTARVCRLKVGISGLEGMKDAVRRRKEEREKEKSSL